jgi:hypothetical protein
VLYIESMNRNIEPGGERERMGEDLQHAIILIIGVYKDITGQTVSSLRCAELIPEAYSDEFRKHVPSVDYESRGNEMALSAILSAARGEDMGGFGLVGVDENRRLDLTDRGREQYEKLFNALVVAPNPQLTGILTSLYSGRDD